MEEISDSEPTWLERMHIFLTWKVIGFDFRNPFERTFSDNALRELSTNLEALRKFSGARALMDGEEILAIKNLKDPVIETDHPSLSKLRKADLQKYFDKCGVRKDLERQLLKLQQDCRKELESRKAASRKKLGD